MGLLNLLSRKNKDELPIEALVDRKPQADDRYMNLAIEKHNWQIAWRLTFCLLAISVVFNGYYMTTSKYIPVPFAVDNFGYKIVIGPVTKANPFDLSRAVRREVEDFVVYSRSLSSDNLYQKKMIRYVGSRVHSGSKAEAVFKEFQQMRPPFETNKQFTYEVEVKSNLMQTNNTYHVEWIERQRSLSGEVLQTERWKAIITFALQPSNDEENIMSNIIGFYVENISWSRMR